MPTRKYKTPPIEEALVEFRFQSDAEWDLTVPGRLALHDKIKAIYNGGSRTMNLVETTINKEDGQVASVAFGESLSRVQLLSNEASRLLTVGKDVLSVNTLRPYDKWELFRVRVSDALAAYFDTAKPIGVARVGVRYVNRLSIPAASVNPTAYIRFSLPSPEGIPNKTSAFISRTEYLYDDNVKLVLHIASLDAPPKECAFLLDLDVIQAFPEPVDIGTTLRVVNDLHDRENKAFEALITDKSREQFDAN